MKKMNLSIPLSCKDKSTVHIIVLGSKGSTIAASDPIGTSDRIRHDRFVTIGTRDVRRGWIESKGQSLRTGQRTIDEALYLLPSIALLVSAVN